jgi:hypothetical protein
MAGSPLQQWWDRLSDAQRSSLKTAAAEHRLTEEPASQLLADTECPVRSVEPRWELDSGPGRVWIMPELIRRFIAERT